MEYTHRDRRAHRDVGRAFWVMVGVSLGLTGLAFAVPLPFVGVASVVALAVTGAVYIGWSDRLLASYATDLRLARDGGDRRDFLRVEASSAVGLERSAGAPSGRSPNVRRRPAGAPSAAPVLGSAAGPRSVSPSPDAPVPPADGS